MHRTAAHLYRYRGGKHHTPKHAAWGHLSPIDAPQYTSGTTPRTTFEKGQLTQDQQCQTIEQGTNIGEHPHQHSKLKEQGACELEYKK